MNSSDPDKEAFEDLAKYAVAPDFLEGVDLGPSTLEAHLATPEVSYEQYRCQKELECGEIVAHRKSVYLDTRFWIHLRDADLGKPVPAVYDRLLRELRRGVADGRLVCPFAADMLAEVHKQSDRTTRLATARLIDELSLKVALKSEPERLAIELHHGIQAIRPGAPPQEPLRRLVWTCSTFAVGHAIPSSPEYDPATELAIQKSFLDTIWRLGFSHQMLGEEDVDYKPGEFNDMWDGLAERLNNLNVVNAKEEKPRRQIETEEFSGALQAYLPVLRNVIRHILTSAFNEQPNDEMEAEIEKAAPNSEALFVKHFASVA